VTARPGAESFDAIDIRRVEGRRTDGVNEVEVAAVIDEVAHLLSDAAVPTVGVLSPFRDQAAALEAALLAAFDAEDLERGGVRVGTVDGFEDTDRDVVVLSLAVDEPSSFLEDPNLFNVMVTRARKRMIVVTSLRPGREGDGLVAAYFRWAEDPHLPRPSDPPSAGWIAALAGRLVDRGLPVVADHPVGGYIVDLVVGEGAAAWGVECAVYEDDPVRHLDRHLDLVRVGWRLTDVFESRWSARPEEAVEGLVATVLGQSDPTRPGGQ